MPLLMILIALCKKDRTVSIFINVLIYNDWGKRGVHVDVACDCNSSNRGKRTTKGMRAYPAVQ